MAAALRSLGTIGVGNVKPLFYALFMWRSFKSNYLFIFFLTKHMARSAAHINLVWRKHVCYQEEF